MEVTQGPPPQRLTTIADVDQHIDDIAHAAETIVDKWKDGETHEQIAEWLAADIRADGTDIETETALAWLRDRFDWIMKEHG